MLEDIFIVCIPITIMLLIFFSIYYKREERESKRRRKALTRMMERCSYKVSVSQLVEEFDANEIAAMAKYRGSLVCVEGSIASVTVHILTPVVTLYSVESGDNYFVVCRMQNSEMKPLEHVQARDEVNIYGVAMGSVKFRTAQMEMCLIATEAVEVLGGRE